MNEPTPEQIEAAAEALYGLEPWRAPSDRYHHTDSPVYLWDELSDEDRESYRVTSRAALVAAGVTPQEPEAQDKAGDADRPTIGLAREIAAWDQGYATTQRIPHWAVNLAMHLIDGGYTLGTPVQVDEAKLADEIGWDPPGWDSRKELASLFQDHCTIPTGVSIESIYPALIAVAGHGYGTAKEHVLAAAVELLRGGGR